MIYKVLTYPNPILKEIAKNVYDIDQNLIDHIKNLKETMNNFPFCSGLASTQVGDLRRVIVINANRFRKPPKHSHGELVLINPEIIKREGSLMFREGCLSVPSYTGNVERSLIIEVKAITEKGEEKIFTFEKEEAVLVQHEIDHLDGKLFLDHIKDPTNLFKRKNS